MKLPLTVEKLQSGHHFQLKITKGHNSVKNLIQVMVLVLYTSSDPPLYLYQVFKWTHKKCTKGNNSVIKGILCIFMKFSENAFSVLKVTNTISN